MAPGDTDKIATINLENRTNHYLMAVREAAKRCVELWVAVHLQLLFSVITATTDLPVFISPSTCACSGEVGSTAGD